MIVFVLVAQRFDVAHRGETVYLRRARSTAAERGEHGTVAAYNGGCRCSKCVRAKRARWRETSAARKVLAGREAVFKVSTTRAWRHVGELRGAGWSVASIARAAGVCEATVWRLGRAERCWNLVAAAVLALEP
jgi:hypothetical protein